MCQPVTHLNVGSALNNIALDTVFALQLAKPALDKLLRVVVVREKKTREHSRISAKPPGVVCERPELNEGKAGISRNPPHAFAMRKFRLDGANARHLSSHQPNHAGPEQHRADRDQPPDVMGLGLADPRDMQAGHDSLRAIRAGLSPLVPVAARFRSTREPRAGGQCGCWALGLLDWPSRPREPRQTHDQPGLTVE